MTQPRRRASAACRGPPRPPPAAPRPRRSRARRDRARRPAAGVPAVRDRRGRHRRARARLARPARAQRAGVRLVVPLVSQGELIGVLNLGPRLSEQDYSSDDRQLLDNLAAQAAPALRVGQLVREQEAEAATRQRFESELEVARLIQHNFLPQELPDLPAGRSPPTTGRPARSAATSTTSSRCPTAGSPSSSATSPTRASPPRW